jgi:acetyltransferase-like isoleucine patch superfamily enzyme
VWHYAAIRESARIGEDCILAAHCGIDFESQIGNRVKVQSWAGISHPARIEDGAFIGPFVMLINDVEPRSINVDGTLKGYSDWHPNPARVGRGASLAAHAVLGPGVVIGDWALVGAGAVVTKDVPERAVVIGSPARIVGFVCDCCGRLDLVGGVRTCRICKRAYPNFVEGRMRLPSLR